MQKVLRQLKGLEPKISKKIVKSALRQAIKPIAQQTKANAPVKTGALRSSVKVRATKRSKKGFGVQVQISKGAFQGDQWYGSVQELGAKKGKLPAKHFMERAFKAKGDEVRRKAIELIKVGIKNLK